MAIDCKFCYTLVSIIPFCPKAVLLTVGACLQPKAYSSPKGNDRITTWPRVAQIHDLGGGGTYASSQLGSRTLFGDRGWELCPGDLGMIVQIIFVQMDTTTYYPL